MAHEKRLSHGPYSCVLTIKNSFSCDSREVLYDNRTRGMLAPSHIEAVDVATGAVRTVYRDSTGAKSLVVTCHPSERKAVFIGELADPAKNGAYSLTCRHGLIVDLDSGEAENLDARDIYAPFTPGALRGGSHVHVFSPDGTMISNTYEDAVLAALGLDRDCAEGDANLRNVEINVLGRPVNVPEKPGNVSGCSFTYAAAVLHSHPRPGSDEISTAIEEGFIGNDGYLRADGVHVKKAIACIGKVRDKNGETVPEVFVIDLPEGEPVPGDGPLEGTATRRPLPPRGTVQRRVTHLADRKFPGIRGARHWLYSTPDGENIIFLAPDDDGVIQAYRVSPNGGAVTRITSLASDITSAYTVSPDGRDICFFSGGSLMRAEILTGRTEELLAPSPLEPVRGPVVWSPDGTKIVYGRRENGIEQLFCAFL